MKRLLLTLIFSLCTVSGFALEVGEEAPPFVNPDLQARYVLSKKIIGNGWVILDFFATYCDGCKKELPEIEALYKEFKDYGLSVIVFAVDVEGVKIVSPYFKKNPTDLTIVIDRYNKTAAKYGVQEIPALFLVNPEGIIVVKQGEYTKENIPEIKAFLSSELLPDSKNEVDAEPAPDTVSTE